MIDTLFLTGGGYKCISYLGALKYLEYSDKLNNIKYIYGASMGSIIATLFTCNYSSNEILDIISKFKFNLKVFEISNLLTNYGIENGKDIIDVILKYVYKKTNLYDPNIYQLNKLFNIQLNICYYNLTNSNLENADPLLPLSIVLRGSCCIPIISYYTISKNEYLIDPYCLYSSTDLIKFWNIDKKNTLCLSSLQKNDSNIEIDSLFSYIFKILLNINIVKDDIMYKSIELYKIPTKLDIVSFEEYSISLLKSEFDAGYNYMKKRN